MSAIFAEDEQHFDPITSELLVGGKIYLGVAGLDPIVNPINVYDNREFTGSPLGQPIIIDVNGRATNKMWVSGKYSLRIDSSADVLKYQNLQNGFDEAVGNIQTTTPLGVNDITAVGVPVQSAYVDNKTYIVTAPANNTGAMTINIDALGVIPIKKAHDQAIVSGDIKADMKLQLIYNSTDNWMELQSAVLGSVFSGGITVTNGIATDTLTASTSIDGVIGGVTPAAATVTNLTATGTNTIAGYVAKSVSSGDWRRSGNQMHWVGEGIPDNYQWVTTIANGTWETIGPTGSGATNTWAILDVLPSNCTAIILGGSVQVDSGGATQTTAWMKVAPGDITPNSSDAATTMIYSIHEATAAGELIVASNWGFVVPVTLGTNIFQVWRNVANEQGTPQGSLYLQGWVED